MARDRTRSRALAADHARQGDGLGWFEALYREAAGDPGAIPWADLAPNPLLVAYHAQHPRIGEAFAGRTCLVIGCGLGDDAEYLAASGGRVTAFDLSETAVRWCERRFPKSAVSYLAANLLAPPEEWARRFDFVFEANTLQALPAELRPRAIECGAGFVAPGGTLLVVCRGREPDEIVEGPPWPLVREEVEAFGRLGLREVSFQDLIVDGDPPVRRFAAEFQR
jgi:SAM-dependent methyltransferase